MRAMPPPCGGKLKARSKVGFKTGKGEGGRWKSRPLPHHFGFDGADVADDAIPVVVGLDRAAPRGAEAPRQRGVVEQPTHRLDHRRRLLRRHEEARLPVAHRVRHVRGALDDGGERLQHGVHALVLLQPRHGHEPAPLAGPVRDSEPHPHCRRLHPGPKVLGIGAEVHDAQPLPVAVEAQLAQHGEREVARPVADGDVDGRAAISTWTRDLALPVLGELGLDGHGQRLRVVHLGTDPERFRSGVDAGELRRRFELPDGGRWLLTVARLVAHKGVDTVLEALPAVVARAGEVGYIVAGNGPERERLAGLAEKLGVAHRVRFLGEGADRDLPALYNLASVYVGASRRAEHIGVEGFGISLVEASACGPPGGAGGGATLLLLSISPRRGGAPPRGGGKPPRRYPPQSLVVSTGRYAGSETSDPGFPQHIDRVGIRATRLRTLNGLALWTRRASDLARRLRPGFAWCGELKPAGDPARWTQARYGLPYGVILPRTGLLLLDAKRRRSAFKRWTARQLLCRCAGVVANSRRTADLARSPLTTLDCPAPAPDGPRV